MLPVGYSCNLALVRNKDIVWRELWVANCRSVHHLFIIMLNKLSNLEIVVHMEGFIKLLIGVIMALEHVLVMDVAHSCE